jgi:hypothetical protein
LGTVATSCYQILQVQGSFDSHSALGAASLNSPSPPAAPLVFLSGAAGARAVPPDVGSAATGLRWESCITYSVSPEILVRAQKPSRYVHNEYQSSRRRRGRGLSKRAWDLFATLDVADVPYALFQRSQVLFDSVR